MNHGDLKQRQRNIEAYFQLFKDEKDMQILAQRLRELYQQPSESIDVE